MKKQKKFNIWLMFDPIPSKRMRMNAGNALAQLAKVRPDLPFANRLSIVMKKFKLDFNKDFADAATPGER